MPITSKPLPHWLNPFYSRVLDLVLPPRCPVTGELVGVQGAVDPAFWAKLNFIHAPLCARCGTPFPHDSPAEMQCAPCLHHPPLFRMARAALLYDDYSAGMILKFKYGDATQLAPIFAHWLVQSGAAVLAQPDIIIPVPLHRWRLFKRRYNQAGLLGAALAAKTGIAHRPDILRRIRATPTQGKKSKAERLENIRNVFALHSRRHDTVKDKKILLVDDVLTSGATVNECTRILLQAGAASVDVLTVARVTQNQ